MIYKQTDSLTKNTDTHVKVPNVASHPNWALALSCSGLGIIVNQLDGARLFSFSLMVRAADSLENGRRFAEARRLFQSSERKPKNGDLWCYFERKKPRSWQESCCLESREVCPFVWGRTGVAKLKTLKATYANWIEIDVERFNSWHFDYLFFKWNGFPAHFIGIFKSHL